MRKLVPAILCTLLPLMLVSQNLPLSNKRVKTLSLQASTVQLDTLTIIPNSVSIFLAKADSTSTTEKLDSSQFQIRNDSIQFFTKTDSTQLLTVRYRVFPFNLAKAETRFDTSQFRRDDYGGIIGFQYDPYADQGDLLDFKGLDYNGSFARGISFGNSQNLVLNSSFNLQLAGDLGDDIEILAAITDENIPIQPEGNTQQLQEFDKIFIQLKRHENQLTAGDYELTRPEGYFMNYYKKLQGATFSNSTQALGKGILRNKASVAIARGKFARNTINAIEGNQGPYKLRGNEGERFIIALAGTEKVFIDGQLVQRGIENDYVIDYNRAEITFTNKLLITKDIRIIVEFEYADQTYLTSLFALNSEYEQGNFKLYLNVYNQQDSKSSVGEEDLSSAQREALAAAGDDLSRAVVSSVDTLEEFDPLRVFYEYRDTIVPVNGSTVPFRILQYSNDRSARLTARFSEVGFGNGNYVLSENQVAASGRIYEWVAPDSLSGQPRGNYEPVIQLSAPQQQQLFTLGGVVDFSKNSRLQTEVALSNNDLNRFSNLGDGDDQGIAAYTNFQQAFDLGKPENGWRLETDLGYEFVQNNFQPLNPYRNAEFVRDWNVQNAYTTQEHIGKGGIAFRKQNLGLLAYEFSGYVQDGLYDGIKHFGQFQLNRAGFDIQAVFNQLQADGQNEQSTFSRPKVGIFKTFEKLGGWKIGAYGEREKNERLTTGTDTLNAASFYYDLYRLTLDSPSGKNFGIGFKYQQRYDFTPVGKNFEQLTLGDEFNVNGNWNAGRASRLDWNMTYRKLQINRPQSTPLEPSETYLGRINYFLNLFKGAMRSNTTYEISSGQEPKIEYNYLQVNRGEGVYQWNDYNRDSIPQVNEFEVAVFQDSANYIRVSLFTDEFIRSNNVQLNQSLNIDPKAIWFQEEGLKKALSKFSTQSTLRIVRRVREGENVSPWNPFQLDVADSSLVATTSTIRNTLFFNRADPVYDIQLGMLDTRNKVVLTSGFESRRTSEQFLRGRWNIASAISTQVNVTTGLRTNDSEFFDNKDYNIQFWSLEPQLTWLPSQSFRTIAAYNFENSKNTLGENGEQATSHDLSLETTFNQSTTTSIRSKFSFVNVNFTGLPNSPVGYVMLQGLQNGQNFLWNVIFDRRLGQNIRLSVSYEGRKTGTSNVVHLGRAQVAAVF